MPFLLLICLIFITSCYAMEPKLNLQTIQFETYQKFLNEEEIYDNEYVYFYNSIHKNISCFQSKQHARDLPLSSEKLYNYQPFSIDDLIGKNGIFDNAKNNLEDTCSITVIDRLACCIKLSRLNSDLKKRLETSLNLIQSFYSILPIAPYRHKFKNKIVYQLKYLLYQHDEIEKRLNDYPSSYDERYFDDLAVINASYHYFLSHIKDSITEIYAHETFYHKNELKITFLSGLTSCMACVIMMPENVSTCAYKGITSCVFTPFIFVGARSIKYFELYYNFKKCMNFITSEQNDLV